MGTLNAQSKSHYAEKIATFSGTMHTRLPKGLDTPSEGRARHVVTSHLQLYFHDISPYNLEEHSLRMQYF